MEKKKSAWSPSLPAHLRQKLLLERKATSWSLIDGEWVAKECDNSAEIAKLQKGQLYTVSIAAPGAGKITFEITKIDGEGVWGVLVSSRVREMTPGETR